MTIEIIGEMKSDRVFDLLKPKLEAARQHWLFRHFLNENQFAIKAKTKGGRSVIWGYEPDFLWVKVGHTGCVNPDKVEKFNPEDFQGAASYAQSHLLPYTDTWRESWETKTPISRAEARAFLKGVTCALFEVKNSDELPLEELKEEVLKVISPSNFLDQENLDYLAEYYELIGEEQDSAKIA